MTVVVVVGVARNCGAFRINKHTPSGSGKILSKVEREEYNSAKNSTWMSHSCNITFVGYFEIRGAVYDFYSATAL